MKDFWLRSLEEAEAAEARARALRDRFGPEAEDRCNAELRSFAASDPRRHQVEDVRRALRWT